MKKLKFLVISFISIGMMFSFLPINAIDYAAEEEKWKAICASPTESQLNVEACRGYGIWLEEKLEQTQDNISEYKGKISEYEDDLAKQVEIANEYEDMIEDLTVEIDQLNNNIVTLEANIENIEQQILLREEEIAEKDRIIIERMRKTQSDLRFGHEIDFLVKARDFSTLIASASVVNDILDFESVQIEEINNLIDQQKEDQNAIELQKQTVINNILEAKVKKEEVVTLKAEVETAIENYKSSMQELAALQSQARADVSATKSAMDDIYEAVEEVVTSGGFVRPIAGGYKSAGVWEYPNGWGMHLGYDYAASVGTPIRAAANGVVLASYDSCPTIGGLGNWCGGSGMGGGGNQVFLLVTVGGQLYGATYFHMQSGSPIASGQTVTAGQTIGRMGSSGNSSGPHVHAEVYYLGSMSINEYINNWSGRLDHGIGMTLANRCDFNGNVPPCRMDPGKAYGFN